MEVSFSAHADQIGLKADVKKFIKDTGITRGTLKGKNQDDDDDTINLLRTPSGYKSYPFNDIVVEEKEGAFLNYDRVQDSPFLVAMIGEVDKILEFGEQ